MKKTKLFHSIIAFTLILSILFSLFVFGPVTLSATAEGSNTSTEEIEYWSGKAATDFAGGSGTIDDPYLIDNGEQLYLMVKVYSDAGTASGSVNTKTYFKLRKDIYLNKVTDADLENPTVDSWNAKGFNPWFTLGGTSQGFCGNFDGDGHTVYGLFAYGGFAGLIPLLADGGNVQNVNLKNSYIYGNTNGGAAGGIVGHVYSYWKLSPVTVSNCLVDNIVVDGGSARTGGIVGGFYNIKVTVTNCAVTNTTLKSHYESYPDYVSGIVGYGGTDTVVSVVTNCYTDSSVHPVNATSVQENFDIIDDKVTYTNVYTSATKNFDADEGVTYLTEADMQGENATANMQGFDFLYQWKVVADNYPVPNQLGVWDGTLATNYAGGSGTKADPYLIENGAQLYKMVSENKDSTDGTVISNYYKITRDIYLNAVSDSDAEYAKSDPATVTRATKISDWDAKGYKSWLSDTTQASGFCGEIDGGGHTVYGLYCKSGTYSGLITSTVGANVYNLNLKNAFIYGSGAAGGIIGQTYGANTVVNVSNCTVDNIFVDGGGGVRIAGIVGGCEGTTSTATKKVAISNCSTTRAKLVTTHSTYTDIQSGILGYTGEKTKNHTVTNCFTDGTVHPVTDTTNSTHFAKFTTYITYSNVYTTKSNTNTATGVTVFTDENQMKGEAAKTNMPGLDYNYDWVVVDGAYPVINPVYVPVWDGTSKVAPSGTGTKDDPYLIENGENLAYVVTTGYSGTPGLYFELTNDIRLNYTAGENWKENANDWVWANARYVGDFNGNGHTIDGLFYDEIQYRFALFPYVGDANLHDFKMTNAYIYNGSSTDPVGTAFVTGQTSAASTFEGIYIDDSCYLEAPTFTGVAGIVGRCNSKAEIKNCAVNATITGSAQVGAFLGTGSSDASTISDSYTATNLPLFGNPDGIFVTYTNAYSLADDDTYATKVDSAENMKGEAAKENMPGLDFDRYWKIVENDYPETRVYNSPSDVWDGESKASSLDEFNGSGTVDDPYEIENAAQLAYVVTTDLENGLYFELVNDIKINDTFGEKWKNHANEWVQNTGIRAVLNLDGNGYTIDGLYFNSSKARMGLFAYIGDSVVKNIKFTNASINHTSDGEGIAIVAGQTSATSTFETIYIDETCEINAPSATGVAAIAARGYNTENAGVNIRDCAVLADITGNSAVGAYVGTYWYSSAVVTVNGCFTNTTLPIRGNSNGTTNAKNNYALAADDYGTNVLASADLMKGEAARTNMPGLVFGAIWETVEDGYPVIVKNPVKSWDGAAEEFAGGSGTAEDPFLIENGGQLYKMVSEYSNMNVARKPANQDNAQPHFRITKDINLGNNEWYKIKYSNVDNLTNTNFTTGFNGVIYGEGHTIYGLNVNGSYAYPVVALIPVATQGAEIYDLQMSYGTAKSNGWNGRSAAALIGLAVGYPSSKSIIIDRCSVENFNIESKYGSAGLVGYIYAQSVSITNSYIKNTNLSVTATDDTQGAGAFIAVARGNSEGNKVLIENCYSDDVSSTIRFLEGGIDTVTSFNNVYTLDSLYDGTSVAGLNKVTATQLQGANAKDTLNGFNFNQIWACGEVGEYPVHKAYDSTVWNGRAAASYAGGDGTAESPYEIATPDQLYKLAIADTESTKGKYYKLTADIKISNIYDGWANDNPYTWAKKTAYLTGFTYGNSFAGTFDGDGHTVTGLYIDENITNGGTYAYGLIPFISANAVVKNVNIDKVKIDVNGNAYVGAVVGAAYSKGDDATNPLANAQIVCANITNCDITTTSAETTGDIIGGSVGGLKVEQCNQANKYDTVITYNTTNFDETAIANIRGRLLGKIDAYITDINANEGFNVCDLLYAKKALLPKEDDDSDEYELVWSQEFGGSELDYSVWSRNTTMSRGATIKYGDLNSVNNGSLTLSCEDTNTTNDSGYKIYNVNYGLDTMNSMSFKYGKLTMRAKIPFYRGAFPSLWLTSSGAIGNSTLTTYGTEIDIFEVFGNGNYDFGDSTWNHTQMVACIHKWYNDENGNKIGTDCSCGTSSDAGNNYIVDESERSTYISSANTTKWHIIEFEWDEDKMTFSVRAEDSDTFTEYYSVTREEIDGNFGLTDKDYSAEGIFDQFLAIRLNNHMYTEGGAYNYSGSTSIDASKLNYEIDYIQLYQKNNGEINLK
ncbi:MAG: family 16 glycosylhydrolase [Clostridia bacterium]|nr:family 16 glycosylhydrolase [Clostridia bacterium]